MLDAHPDLALPSETHFIPELAEVCEDRSITTDRVMELLTAHRRWGDFSIDADELHARIRTLDTLSAAEITRTFFALYGEKQGATRWGDKTPGYIKKMRLIQDEIPEARFIHLIRDGRDVALSVLRMNFGPQTIEAAAERWKERITRGRAQAPWLGHYMEVKFEDLVLDTEGELRRMCEFIELDFHPDMLGYHETAEERLKEKARALPRKHGEAQSAEARLQSHAKTFEPPNPDLIGRWRDKMDPADRESYEQIAGDLLEELGYETEYGQPTDGADVHTPRRGPRLPRPVRRAAQIAGHVTGLRPPADPRPPAPFIVGVNRAGGELLSELLGAHPDLTMPPETDFVPGLAETIRSEPVTPERVVKLIAASHPIDHFGLDETDLERRFAELEDLKAAGAVRAFYDAITAAGGTSRFGDPTLSYVMRMRRIQRVLSEARFIHVVRDGRDVIAARPADTETGRVITMAQRWRKRIENAEEDRDRIDHYLLVRYEDLIADTEGELRKICKFIDLDYDPAMLNATKRAEIEAELGAPGIWRERLSSEDATAFDEVAGDLLASLGYQKSSSLV